MDYETGTVYDFDADAVEITRHPFNFIQCFTTTAGRGSHIKIKNLPDPIINKLGPASNSGSGRGTILKARGIPADRGINQANGSNLSKQIEQAAGTSYSNFSTEINTYAGLTKPQEDLTPFEDADFEDPVLSSFVHAKQVENNKAPEDIQLPQPRIAGLSNTKRAGKGRSYRKLTQTSLTHDSEQARQEGFRVPQKTLGEIFHKPQKFNAASFLKNGKGPKDGYHLGSKSDFPAL